MASGISKNLLLHFDNLTIFEGYRCKEFSFVSSQVWAIAADQITIRTIFRTKQRCFSILERLADCFFHGLFSFVVKDQHGGITFNGVAFGCEAILSRMN